MDGRLSFGRCVQENDIEASNRGRNMHAEHHTTFSKTISCNDGGSDVCLTQKEGTSFLYWILPLHRRRHLASELTKSSQLVKHGGVWCAGRERKSEWLIADSRLLCPSLWA